MSEQANAREIPLFPLGLALLPTMLVPLRIFETRYQKLLADVLDGDRRFGVVLLTRGSEVGNVHNDLDASRSRVGTIARIVRSPVDTSGLSEILIVGEERFRVEEWLPDNPYPRVRIRLWSDEDETHDQNPSEDAVDLMDLLSTTRNELEALGHVLQQAGHEVGRLPMTDANPVTGSFQLAAAAPLQAYDQQQLLEAPTTQHRLKMLRTMIEDFRTLMLMQLDSDSDQ